MTPRNVIVVVVALAVIAAAVTFLLYEPSAAIAQGEAPPRAAAAQQSPITAELASESVAPAAAEPTTAGEAQRTEAQPPAAPPPGPLARIVGRCVDVAGNPLAGCTVDLHGWGANSERMDAWRVDHDEDPPWQDPADVVTAADGHFAFAFWPPPPFQFMVRIDKSGCGHLSGRWSKLGEGETKHVGDVVVAPGVKVRGRVVDKQGAPVAKVSLYFTHEQRGFGSNDGVGPDSGTQARTADDGTFVTRSWLVPGAYGLRVQDRGIESAKSVELVAERADEVLTVVVADMVEQLKISGRVVDEAGAPVAKIEVLAVGGLYGRASTNADGTFVLAMAQRLGEAPTWLQVSSTDYEALEERIETTWGSSDVVIRVRRAGELVMRVTDEALQPVTRYAVRMVQTDAQSRSSEDDRVRTHGEHPHGMATLPGLRRGKWVLLVEFSKESGLEALTHALEVGDVAPDRVNLIAHPTAERTLRVLDTAGEPMAGATVRLCDMFGKTFAQHDAVMNPDHWLTNLANLQAKVLLEGKTDNDGKLALRGPGDRALGLLIGGEGACALWHGEVQLGVEGELVVRVDRAAELTGHCTPPEGLAALRQLAGLGDTDKFDGHRRPKLHLSRGEETFPHRLLQFTNDTASELADDGTFRVTGIPAGAWKIDLETLVDRGNGFATTRLIPLTEVTLVAGQSHEIVLDLSNAIPGTVSARVLHNGVPVTSGSVTFGAQGGGSSLEIGADANCSGSVLPGTYEVSLQPPYLVSPNKVTVRAHEQTNIELQFFSGKVTLQLLDPDGAPAAGVPVFVGDQSWQEGYTDKQGQVQLLRAPGNLQLSVLPKRLCTQEAQQALWKDAQARGDKDPFTPLRIPIGEVVLQVNDDRQVELRLPDVWRQ